jgi:type VI secretion system protein VasD
MNFKYIKIILVFIVLLSLAGCSTIKLDFNAEKNLNPNVQGVPASTVIYVYQLNDEFAFKNATFPELMNGSSSLNSSIISDSSYVVLPGQVVTYDLSAADNAKYLGIVVGYRNLNSKWKKIVPLTTHYLYRKSYDILLTNQGVKVIY